MHLISRRAHGNNAYYIIKATCVNKARRSNK